MKQLKNRLHDELLKKRLRTNARIAMHAMLGASEMYRVNGEPGSGSLFDNQMIAKKACGMALELEHEFQNRKWIP